MQEVWKKEEKNQDSWTSSGDLKYSMGPIVNKTVIYLKIAKRVDVKCSHHTSAQKVIMWGDRGAH